MYLHIGGSQIVFDNELIGIFDIKLAGSAGMVTPLTLNSQSIMRNVGAKNNPKSFVLTDRHLLLSPIGPPTLARRFKNRS